MRDQSLQPEFAANAQPPEHAELRMATVIAVAAAAIVCPTEQAGAVRPGR
ncbi:MAG TPA: hypothetical protein VLD36_04460 [Burkholderiales bacterium]|nr:hypothetical protein [Burkholderiales bacterium]